MSETSTLVTAAHFEYIAARTTGEDDFLRDLKREALAAGLPAIWIAPEQAAFLQILLRAANARALVEIGTLAGYSAIALARALPPDGRLHTIEINPAHADFAERWFARSNVADRITLHRGAAANVLPTFAAQSADAVFIDADKPNYKLYLRECTRIVRPGGLILIDNALAHGKLFDAETTDASVLAIRDFNEHLAATIGLQSVIVPLGDGLWVCVRL